MPMNKKITEASKLNMEALSKQPPMSPEEFARRTEKTLGRVKSKSSNEKSKPLQVNK